MSSSSAANNNSSVPNQPVPSAPPLEDLSRKRQSLTTTETATSDPSKHPSSAPVKRGALKDKSDKVSQDAAKKKPSMQQQLPLHLQQQQQQRKKKEVAASKSDKELAGAAAKSASKPLGKPSVIIGTADPKSKVRSWLLASHCRVDAPTTGLPKSKSSPMNLQANPIAGLPTRPSAPTSRNNTRLV